MTINLSLADAIARFTTHAGRHSRRRGGGHRSRLQDRAANREAHDRQAREIPSGPNSKPKPLHARRAATRPLLETGALRDSIEWSAPHRSGNEVVGYVGSNNPKAVWHELGTRAFPPRSFLATAAAGKGPEIAAMTGRMIYGAMVQGGPHYRELRLALHLAKEVYRAGKDLADDLTHDDNGNEPDDRHEVEAARGHGRRTSARSRDGEGQGRDAARGGVSGRRLASDRVAIG